MLTNKSVVTFAFALLASLLPNISFLFPNCTSPGSKLYARSAVVLPAPVCIKLGTFNTLITPFPAALKYFPFFQFSVTFLLDFARFPTASWKSFEIFSFQDLDFGTAIIFNPSSLLTVTI